MLNKYSDSYVPVGKWRLSSGKIVNISDLNDNVLKYALSLMRKFSRRYRQKYKDNEKLCELMEEADSRGWIERGKIIWNPSRRGQ